MADYRVMGRYIENQGAAARKYAGQGKNTDLPAVTDRPVGRTAAS
jgi:hypothetical protein